jgi:hypothetical protein
MRVLALLLAVLALPAVAAGDTVRLVNGRAYEGVIAESTAEGVRIRLAFGYLVLPHDQVAGIDKGPSALAEYLRRKGELFDRIDADAGDWLALARWARAQELHQGVREAAMLAAELDPELPGLDPLLRPFGLVLVSEIGRWIPLDEAMARRGLVRHGGEWISKEERRVRLAEEARLEALQAEAEAARRMAAVAERRQREEEQRRAGTELGWYGASVVLVPLPIPGVVFAGAPFFPGKPVEPGDGHGRRRRDRGSDALRFRQPGSLLPHGDPGAPPPPPPSRPNSVSPPASSSPAGSAGSG